MTATPVQWARRPYHALRAGPAQAGVGGDVAQLRQRPGLGTAIRDDVWGPVPRGPALARTSCRSLAALLFAENPSKWLRQGRGGGRGGGGCRAGRPYISSRRPWRSRRCRSGPLCRRDNKNQPTHPHSQAVITPRPSPLGLVPQSGRAAFANGPKGWRSSRRCGGAALASRKAVHCAARRPRHRKTVVKLSS